LEQLASVILGDPDGGVDLLVGMANRIKAIAKERRTLPLTTRKGKDPQ
jgi:hypothetical protein